MNHGPTCKQLYLIRLYYSALSHTSACILLVWLRPTIPAVRSSFQYSLFLKLSAFLPFLSTLARLCFWAPNNEPTQIFCPILLRLAPRLVPLWGLGGWRTAEGREQEQNEVWGAALLETDVYGWCCIAPFSRRKCSSSQLQVGRAE